MANCWQVGKLNRRTRGEKMRPFKNKIVLETKLTLAEIEERFDLHVVRQKRNWKKYMPGFIMGAYINGNIDGNKIWFDAMKCQYETIQFPVSRLFHEFKGEIYEKDNITQLVGKSSRHYLEAIFMLPLIILTASGVYFAFTCGHVILGLIVFVLLCYPTCLCLFARNIHDESLLNFLTNIIDAEVVEYNGKDAYYSCSVPLLFEKAITKVDCFLEKTK